MAIIKKKSEEETLIYQIKNFPKNSKINLKEKLLLMIIPLSILIFDQITKILVIKNIPYLQSLWGNPFEGIFRIVHVRNRAIAFSLGHNLPDFVKIIVFIVLPLIVLLGIILYLFSNNKVARIQKIALATIVGGGLGNIFDRIFRFSEGVIDWVDTMWFGIKSLENIPLLKLLSYDRWPTWNLADASILIGCAILLVGLIKEDMSNKKKK